MLIISHLARTIRAADRIAVIEDGSLVESGDHASLLQSHGLYFSMFGEKRFDDKVFLGLLELDKSLQGSVEPSWSRPAEERVKSSSIADFSARSRLKY